MRCTHLIATLSSLLAISAAQIALANPHHAQPGHHTAPIHHPAAPAHIPHTAPIHHPAAPVHIPHTAPIHHPAAPVHIPHTAPIHHPAAPIHHPVTTAHVHPTPVHQTHAQIRPAVTHSPTLGITRGLTPPAPARTMLGLLNGNKLTAQVATKYIPTTNRVAGVLASSTNSVSRVVTTVASASPINGMLLTNGAYDTYAATLPGQYPVALSGQMILPVSGIASTLPVNATAVGSDWGLRIVKVYPDFPAAKAELRVGDIIVTAAGKRVQSSAELTEALQVVSEATEIVFFNSETMQLEKTSITPVKGKIGVNTEAAPIPN